MFWDGVFVCFMCLVVFVGLWLASFPGVSEGLGVVVGVRVGGWCPGVL